jgi:hypothetical protein
MFRKPVLAAVLLLLVSVQRADAAATASPNLTDQTWLSQDPTFQNRVRESFINYCNTTILVENGTTAINHIKRINFCSSLIATIGALDNFKVNMAELVAANGTVISDATVAGATPITSAAIAITQAAIIPDSDINNAMGASFNLFLSYP